MLCAALVLGLHLGTYHANREAGYREINQGVYATCLTDLVGPPAHLSAGIYYNSHRRTSVYAGVTYPNVIGPIDITAGLVLGYPRGPMPLVVPSYKPHENVRLTFTPPVAGISGALHLSIERKF